MTLNKKPKPYSITKEQVWEAYKLVRGNGEAPGVDGTIENIEANPGKHQHPVWNRFASGSYFPPAVKRQEIPKGEGKVRILGKFNKYKRLKRRKTVYFAKLWLRQVAKNYQY